MTALEACKQELLRVQNEINKNIDDNGFIKFTSTQKCTELINEAEMIRKGITWLEENIKEK